MKLCCCCEFSSMWMGKGMSHDVQVLVLGKNHSSHSPMFVSKFCLDASGPARNVQCLSYTVGTALAAATSRYGGSVLQPGSPETGGLESFVMQGYRHMLLLSQQTSLLEIRSCSLYLKSKNVQRFSITPSLVSTCVFLLPLTRLVLHSQGTSSDCTCKRT